MGAVGLWGCGFMGFPPIGNVLKEICDPAGAVIYASRFQVGDPQLCPIATPAP